MGIGNLITKQNKFEKEYMATVVTNEDPLMRGRLKVKIPHLMGETPIWVDCSNQIGKVNLQLIPEPDDTVTVKFRNKDIYSGVWELKGNPIDGTEQKQIDPKKYGFYDEQGNCIIIDRATNNIVVTAMNDYNVTVQNCMNIIVTADVNMTVNGNVTQNITGNTDITCPQTTIHGKLHVDGLVTSDTDFRQAPKDVGLITHVHPYTWTDPGGAADTSPGKN